MEVTSDLIQDTYDKYNNVMNGVTLKYRKIISIDEIDNLKLHAVHKALINFKKDKNTKFQTYLCSYVQWEIGDYLKTEMRFKMRHNQQPISSNYMTDNTIRDFQLDISSTQYKEIGEDRIIAGLTFAEIGRKHNISKETARKRFIEFTKLCKEKGV